MGVRTTLLANPPSANMQAQAQKTNAVNASAISTQLAQQLSEVVYLLKEYIKTCPTGNLTAASNPSTSSPNISMAQVIPSWVAAGMTVTDVTAGHLLGTVASGAGTLTLVLGANSAFAGSGTSDILQISDPGLATYQGLITSLG